MITVTSINRYGYRVITQHAYRSSAEFERLLRVADGHVGVSPGPGDVGRRPLPPEAGQQPASSANGAPVQPSL